MCAVDDFPGANLKLFHLRKFGNSAKSLMVEDMEELHNSCPIRRTIDFYLVALPGAALFGAVIAVVLSWL